MKRKPITVEKAVVVKIIRIDGDRILAYWKVGNGKSSRIWLEAGDELVSSITVFQEAETFTQEGSVTLPL